MEQKLLLFSQLSVHNTLCEVTLNSAALSWRPRGDNTHKRAAGRRNGPLNAVYSNRMKVSVRGLQSSPRWARMAAGFHSSQAGATTDSTCLISSSWSPVSHQAGSQYVPVCEIISVQETEEDCASTGVGKWQKVPQTPVESNQHAFTVFFVERTQKHRWRCSEVTLHCIDRTLCLQWVQAIREQLSLLTIRPKRLLVYINPYGGKHHGKRIYEQKVAPIFSRASISTDVIVTEWANHARDHLKTEAELKKYDGVVCVGGDGMFSEIIHGLISRTQCDSGVDQNLSDETLIPCSLRIGIIPAGSTDCICYATVGSNDPVTSALHIVVGDSQPMDVCSIHHNNTFLRYSVSLLGYGFYGDVLTDSERKRWMGPARYDISGVKTFLSHRYYEGTITFLPADENVGTPRDKLQCRSGCNICSLPSADKQGSKDEESVSDTDTKGVWQVIRGKFLAINAACMSCACPRSPKGLSPSAHLADGTADLILVRRCSRFDFLRHLLRHTNKDDQFDYPFVEVYRVRQFHFTPKYEETDSELDLREADGSGRKRFFSRICREHPACNCSLVHSSWNCDGEILPHAAIQVRVHCQLIKLFARGIEEHSVFEEPYALSAI